MTKSKTTMAGLLGAVGAAVSTLSRLFDGDSTTNPDWALVAAVFTMAWGLWEARDHKTSDEQAGAGVKPPVVGPTGLPGNILKCVLAAGLLAIGSGCASILPGHDPVVVNAERTTAMALDTFDTFLALEADHRVELEKIAPGIHAAAERIRRNGPRWLETARILTREYKHNRSDQNKAQLFTALAVLESGLSEAQKYLAATSER